MLALPHIEWEPLLKCGQWRSTGVCLLYFVGGASYLCLCWACFVFCFTRELASLFFILTFCWYLDLFSLPRDMPLVLWPLKSTSLGVSPLGVHKDSAGGTRPVQSCEETLQTFTFLMYSFLKWIVEEHTCTNGLPDFTSPKSHHGVLSQEITSSTLGCQSKRQSVLVCCWEREMNPMIWKSILLPI